MIRFVNSTKKKYRDRLINREQQWPYCHGDKLIYLDLIEGERGQVESGSRDSNRRPFSKKQKEEGKVLLKRTPIAYADLFKVEGKKKSVRKVLVEGDAGIGKTTVSTTISEDWANDKLFQEFVLLLLLPLREREVAKASSLLELLMLFHPSESVCTSVANFIEEEEGENTLIVADGWDELGVAESGSESFLYKLLFGKIFPFMSVVVTSRYSASASLHNLPYIDRFIEIHGFNKENIADFIGSEFSNDHTVSSNLLKKLENSPLIGSVCSIPLCCVIICHLWRTLQEDLPNTMTELYTKITLNIIIRNIGKSFPECMDIMSFSYFDSLPEDLKQSWNLLCEFAFLTIAKDQIVFSRDELVSVWPHGLTIDENIFRFGLLQAAQSIFAVGRGTSFHFLHLTFQEYLAALHLSKQPFETQAQVCNKNAKTGHFDMVIRFLFGITGQIPGSEEAVDKLLTYISHSCTPSTVCHCLFEAGHTNLAPVELACELLLKYSFQSNSPHAVHDFSALLHVLSHTHKHCLMSVGYVHCGITSKQITELGQALAVKKGKLQIESLILSGNKLTNEDMSALFSDETAVVFKSLSHLTVDDNEIGAKGLESIMTTVQSTHLMEGKFEILSLSHNPLGISGLQVLELAICSGTLTTLEQLSLRGSLSDDADTNATLLISLSASLSAYCPILSLLDVSENNFGIPGSRALGTVLSQLNQHENEHDFHLKLTDTNFHCGPSSCNIIFSSYKYQSVSINLSNNPIGLDGVTFLGQMISNNQISRLYLKQCQLTRNSAPIVHVESSTTDVSHTVSSIGWQLSTIQSNLSLARLCIDGNVFSGKNIDILAGFIHLCPHLFYLSCSNCCIDSNDLKNLFIRLNEMKSPQLFDNLDSWRLDENKIDDDGISTLIEYLPSLLRNLNVVCVEDNMVSRQMRRKLNDTLNQKARSNEARIYSNNEWELQAQWQDIVSDLYKLAVEYLSNNESIPSHEASEDGPQTVPFLSLPSPPLPLSPPILPSPLSLPSNYPSPPSPVLPPDTSPSLPSPLLQPSRPSLSSPLLQSSSPSLPSSPPSSSFPSLPLPPSPSWSPSLSSLSSPPLSPSRPSLPSLQLPPSSPSLPSPPFRLPPSSTNRTSSLSIKLLHQLDLLEGNCSTVRIINTVASKWDKVALRLHFSGHDISRIERDHKDSVVRACRTMLSEWLEGKGRKPITWDTLIKALREADFSELASELETILSTST